MSLRYIVVVFGWLLFLTTTTISLFVTAQGKNDSAASPGRGKKEFSGTETQPSLLPVQLSVVGGNSPIYAELGGNSPIYVELGGNSPLHEELGGATAEEEGASLDATTTTPSYYSSPTPSASQWSSSPYEPFASTSNLITSKKTMVMSIKDDADTRRGRRRQQSQIISQKTDYQEMHGTNNRSRRGRMWE